MATYFASVERGPAGAYETLKEQSEREERGFRSLVLRARLLATLLAALVPRYRLC